MQTEEEAEATDFVPQIPATSDSVQEEEQHKPSTSAKKRKRKRQSKKNKKKQKTSTTGEHFHSNDDDLIREEKRISLQSQALPVLQLSHDETVKLAEETWQSKAIESPEEYLLRVRLEAQRCEQTVVATHINPRDFDGKQTAHRRVKQHTIHADNLHAICSDPEYSFLLPTRAWADQCLLEFTSLRDQVERHTRRIKQVPEDYELSPDVLSAIPDVSKDWEPWKAFCFGTVSQANIWDESKAMRPSLKLILSLDYVTCNTLLHQMMQWLCQDKIFSHLRFSWLYNMMLFIDYPVSAKLASDMNDVLTWIIEYRSKLSKDIEATEISLPHLNLLLIIMTKFFKQGPPDLTLFPADSPPEDHQTHKDDEEEYYEDEEVYEDEWKPEEPRVRYTRHHLLAMKDKFVPIPPDSLPSQISVGL